MSQSTPPDVPGTAGRWPPVFPYSVRGAPPFCRCVWEWRTDLGRFVIICPAENCPWCILTGLR